VVGIDTALEALRAELGQACFTTTLDVSQPEAWANALQRFWPAAGERLDVLFNNAGMAVTDPFASTDIWRLHKVVDVNLKGACRCMPRWAGRQPFLPCSRRSRPVPSTTS
jgi:NADP-dependent 3-hydroxy acid dehydrogenase YdfG